MSFAALRLELHHPIVRDQDTRNEAWRYLDAVLRDVRRGVQRALGDILVLLRDLRAKGQNRWATAAEKQNAKLGVPLPIDCWDLTALQQIREILSKSVRDCNLSEYVYASVAERMSSSEFSGSKLRTLLACSTAYPVARNVAIVVRSRNVAFSVVEGAPQITITSLRPGEGRVVLDCKRLHGRGAPGMLAVLAKLESNVWKHGAVSIHRRERDNKWYVIVPYDSGKLAEVVGQSAAVHRGVAHWLTLVTERGDVAHLPGTFVAAHKAQYGRRRRMLQQQIAALGGRGRGARDKHRALTRLQDGEARWVDTAAWRAAKWIERECVRLGVARAVVDDFAQPFDGDDDAHLPWYIRRFPMGLVRDRVKDALSRRAGIEVTLMNGRYVSRQCCACGHEEQANVVRLARVGDAASGPVPGIQRCTKCGTETELDEAAARNLLRRSLLDGGGGLHPPEGDASSLPDHLTQSRQSSRPSARKRGSPRSHAVEQTGVQERNSPPRRPARSRRAINDEKWSAEPEAPPGARQGAPSQGDQR